MAWATMDDVIAGLAAGQLKPIWFPSTTGVLGRLTDLNSAGVGRWRRMAVPAAASAGGTVHVDSDAGFPAFVNATPPQELRLAQATLGVSAIAAMSIYDRVWSCSGLDGTLTTAQNVTGFPAIARPDANGTGLEMFAEVWALIGTVTVTITVTYTNSAGTSGRVTSAQSIGGTGLRELYRLIPLPLAAGDTGVKSVQSVTLSASTTTAGNFGIVLAQRLTSFNSFLIYNQPPLDFAKLGLPLISPDAALMFVCQAGSATTPIIDGQIVIGKN